MSTRNRERVEFRDVLLVAHHEMPLLIPRLIFGLSRLSKWGGCIRLLSLVEPGVGGRFVPLKSHLIFRLDPPHSPTLVVYSDGACPSRIFAGICRPRLSINTHDFNHIPTSFKLRGEDDHEGRSDPNGNQRATRFLGRGRSVSY